MSNRGSSMQAKSTLSMKKLVPNMVGSLPRGVVERTRYSIEGSYSDELP